MTSTDELRAKLDELGIEHRSRSYGYKDHVWWEGGDGVGWHAENRQSIDGSYVKVDAVLTPEQAVAATVGAGTCKGEIDTDYFECKLTTFKCHSCGWSGIVDDGYAGYSFGDTDMPRYCPNCGRRIEVSK